MQTFFPVAKGCFYPIDEKTLDGMEMINFLSPNQRVLIKKIILEENERCIVLTMVDGNGILHCIVQNKAVMLETREIDIDGNVLKMGRSDDPDEMWYELITKILIASGKVSEDIAQED